MTIIVKYDLFPIKMWKTFRRNEHNVSKYIFFMHALSLKFQCRKKFQSRFERMDLIKEHSYKYSGPNSLFSLLMMCKFRPIG